MTTEDTQNATYARTAIYFEVHWDEKETEAIMEDGPRSDLHEMLCRAIHELNAEALQWLHDHISDIG